ncbi:MULTISPECIES: YhdH/YhfP family quinone oxidoreductase [Marinobacter]|uniref:YhdH/YhfP family quinone oxidoreductase n=1 Tax=Marinobacter TaxID=2742 RepID=UPI002004D816|nr:MULTISPECIES: YhdH/YhfP family quinone oxidoreductase [Marinobacter]MCK7550100.1 YhdH/YhfP family quinone oxidoreductase [Marinobacter goseongensis]MDV3503616.1 YhdH/YhfP family quinone oxidoreductase [Marinobacter sp. M-5]
MTNPTEFKAWQVRESNGEYQGSEQTLNTADLPDNDVLIKVSHSSLNYKDALSASGNKGVTRNFPHTPGIDAAGEVVDSATGEPAVGSKVIVTGYDLGMNTAGGFGEYIRVPVSWCVAMAPGWDARTAMIYGTAGLTAGLCVQKLLTMGARPEQGKVAVSGASGAVGSVAVELLAGLGFDVVAISGKAGHTDELKALGASEVVGRDALAAEKKPMLKPVFANAVDTVGGQPLAELLKQILPGGSVSCCGLVAGPQLETTVLPFILRGVNLLGVDSVEIPLAEKAAIWEKFAGAWACPKTEATARTIGRGELDGALQAFLKGESSGKIVLDHSL